MDAKTGDKSGVRGGVGGGHEQQADMSADTVQKMKLQYKAVDCLNAATQANWNSACRLTPVQWYS